MDNAPKFLPVSSTASDPSRKPTGFVGIDLAKGSFQAALRTEGGEVFNLSFLYNADGIAQLLEKLQPWTIELIVMEATGGLERKLSTELAAADYNLAIINPRQSRDFAKAMGRLAKTDKVDADTLAQLARILKPQARPLPSPEQTLLKDLAARRRQLIHMRTQELNRSQQTSAKDIKKSIDKVIKLLDREVEKIEKQITDLIDSNSDWKNKARILDSAPGVGIDTAHALLANLPEIGQLSKREVASLAGLAPFDFSSGNFKGQRQIWGGRASVRSSLYMATLTAIVHNPVIKCVYDRLVTHGKNKKLAVTACMRKLLTILNAMVRHDSLWNPKFVSNIA